MAANHRVSSRQCSSFAAALNRTKRHGMYLQILCFVISSSVRHEGNKPSVLVGVTIIIFTGHCLSTHGCELGPTALCHSRLLWPSLLVHTLLGGSGGSPLALLLLHLLKNQQTMQTGIDCDSIDLWIDCMINNKMKPRRSQDCKALRQQLPDMEHQSINQSTDLHFLSLGLIRGVDRHWLGKQHTLSTKCSRHLTIEHQRNCWSDSVMEDGFSTATPFALH